MKYEQCLKYLERIQNLGIKFGLDNVKTILSSFKNPYQKYPSILVAGTNGKGSVCAMLTHILTLHGFQTGLFTSPHLVKPEERIRIGNRLISSRSFCRILTVLKAKIEELIAFKKLRSPPTYFEFLTCMALIYFGEQNVDMAVLEVGMGGRFDATNIVEPCVSVITTISGEHQKFLGESLSQIAFEKAGIVKPGIPVVCGVRQREAYDTIKKRAEEVKAPFFGVFERKGCFSTQKEEESYSFVYRSHGEKYVFSPSLPGEHQGKNASVAIAAAEHLSTRWKKLKKEKIIEGIERVKWEGRLEVISRRPLIILDGAHNIEGALVLKKYIKDFLSPPLILVFAMMRDKEIGKITDILFPLAEKVILTRFPFFKAASPEDIEAQASAFQGQIIIEPDPLKSLKLAVRRAGSEGRVIVAGSLFLVGEIKKYGDFPQTSTFNE
jgi:dihydrofolate synthase/folylpolyglutamate synthase